MAGKNKAEPAEDTSQFPSFCRKTVLAQILDVSPRTIADLDARGKLVRGGPRGHYETLPSIHLYLKNLREQAAGRATTTGITLADERAKSERINRQIQELKLADLQGQVVPVDEIAASWGTFCTAVRTYLMAVPSKARAKIPHLTAHDAETIREICRDTLMDLADEVETVVGGDAAPLRKKKNGKSVE